MKSKLKSASFHWYINSFQIYRPCSHRFFIRIASAVFLFFPFHFCWLVCAVPGTKTDPAETAHGKEKRGKTGDFPLYLFQPHHHPLGRTLQRIWFLLPDDRRIIGPKAFHPAEKNKERKW